MRIKLQLLCLAASLCVLSDAPVLAASSSQNFVLDKGVVSGGGGSASSQSFSTATVLGQSSPAGNMESPAYKIDAGFVSDTTPPVLSCPADIIVPLNTPASEPAIAEFLAEAAATDDMDASVTIAHSAVPSVFSPVGNTVVGFTATDDAGNSSSCSAGIKSVYVFGGFTDPLVQERPFKLNGTVPVKFQLKDAYGNFVSGAFATIALQKYSDTDPLGDPIDGIASGSDTGNTFRYDITDEQYIFNLSTKGLMTGTWQVRVTLNDDTAKTILMHLK